MSVLQNFKIFYKDSDSCILLRPNTCCKQIFEIKIMSADEIENKDELDRHIYVGKLSSLVAVIQDIMQYQQNLSDELQWETVPNLYMIESEIQKCIEKHSKEIYGEKR